MPSRLRHVGHANLGYNAVSAAAKESLERSTRQIEGWQQTHVVGLILWLTSRRQNNETVCCRSCIHAGRRPRVGAD